MVVSGLKNKVIRFISRLVEPKNGVLFFYNRSGEGKIFDLIREVKAETGMLLAPGEAYQVYFLTKKTGKIPGDIAEVGVYRGGSAKLIAEAKREEKSLYLFDTFEGLPELSQKDNPDHFHQSQFPSSFEEVQDRLSKYPNVHVYKGLFPAAGGNIIQDKKFSFVNLDTDLYESTLACLEFFYPRMNQGAIILSHDYPKAIGVKQAFDEFFANKPEIVLEATSRQQCFVVKL